MAIPFLQPHSPMIQIDIPGTLRHYGQVVPISKYRFYYT